MKKRVLSVLLATAMTASLLAGCGSSKTSTDNSAAATESAATATEASSTQASSGDVYEMVMEVTTLGTDDADISAVQDAINAITVPKIGVKVKFMTVPIMDMATKLSLLSASGEQLDLVQSGLLRSPSSLASQGLIVPITKYLSDNLKTKAGSLLEACKVGDDVYAYPGNLYCAVQAELLYDTDLAKQYNIKIPTVLATDKDWEDLFAQVKSSGMSQYAISLGDGVAAENQWGNVYDSLGDGTFNAYGIISDIQNGKTIENYYASDMYKALTKQHRSWYTEGYALPDSISNGYTTMDSMQQGQVFSFATRVGTGNSVAFFSKSTNKNLAAIPIQSDTKTIDRASVLNTAWAVSSSSKNPQKVCDFLDLMYSDDALATLMNYGIEGKHYKVTEGSKILAYPDGVDASNVGYGNFIGTYGDMKNQYFRAPLTDDFVKNLADFGPEKASISKFVGYSFDTKSVESEISAVDAVIGQYGPALSCGTVDPDQTIPGFLDALKGAGIDKIITENQKQLDAWLSK